MPVTRPQAPGLPHAAGVVTATPDSVNLLQLCGLHTMLKLAILFFIISLLAGFFGFTGVASGARSIAKVFFFIALALFLIVLIFGVFLGMLAF
jgi:uncharacterized membrane protein YtjA (UPF0391 family)